LSDQENIGQKDDGSGNEDDTMDMQPYLTG